MSPPWVIKKKWFTPPWGSKGITLYPFVFVKKDVSERVIRHEMIHVYQVRQEGWWKFYLGYLWKIVTGGVLRLEWETSKHEQDPKYLPEDLELKVQEFMIR